MRFSGLLASTALLTAVTAAPAGHIHKNKRDVVTTTVHHDVTLQVIVGPDGKPIDATAATPAAAVNVASAVNADVVETSQAAVAAASPAAAAASPAAAAASSSPAAAAASSTQAASSSSSSSSSSNNSDNSSAGFAAGAKGVTYSPYTNNGGCKSTSEVASDIAKLSDFSVIRLYGVDCNQVANVLQAKGANQKLFLGVYYVDQISSSIQTMAAAISQYGSWDDVITVSIGNELVNSGSATPSQVGGYVAEGRSALQAAGYNGKVVSVDTFIAVINNPELCNYSDYMAVNAHAFFDANTTADKAGPWVLLQIQRVWSACNGSKDVLITESGWPKQGDACGVAVPSLANQQTAISSIKQTCGDSTILFNAFNDYWKADGAYNAEKYWGILDN